MIWKKKKIVQDAREMTKKFPAAKKSPDMTELKELEQRIEEKLALLKALEAKADRKIEALEKLLYSSMALKPQAGRIDRGEEILALGEKGLDALEIAKILGVPAGEVELILNLNKKNSQ